MALSKNEIIERIQNKFGNKFTYDFSKVVNGNSNIRVVCPIHGVFSMRVNYFLDTRHGCQQCGKENRKKSNQRNAAATEISLNKHVENFKEVFGDMYTYPDQEFKNSHSKIRIICPEHGDFYKHIHAHYKGSGCQQCRIASFKKKTKIKKTEQERIDAVVLANKNRVVSKEIIEKLFFEKFKNKFVYNWAMYAGKSQKITITCPAHGDFLQSPGDHLKYAFGCPSCAKFATSKKEQDWLKIMNIEVVQHEVNLGTKIIKVDGYDEATNTVYEFLGDYWHGHPRYRTKHNGINQNNKITFDKLFFDTEERLTQLKKLGYSVSYVWENDFNKDNYFFRIFNKRLEYK